MDIQEAVVDERQRKVWVHSLVTVGGKVKDCMTMMRFDGEGLMVHCMDNQRTRRGDRE